MSAMTPPTYRARLRLEGLVLVGCGALAFAVVAVIAPPEGAELVGGGAQLLLLAGLLVVFGPRSAQRAMDRAKQVPSPQLGSGEPTPLWHVVAIVVVLTPFFALPSGGVGGLTFSGGAVLVGLAQAFLLERTVAAEEREAGRCFFRLPGSRILRGTKLGWTPSTAEG